jgi:predicted AAA+ superfamily ATPase
MTAFGLSEGYILTIEEEETIQENECIIYVLPVWRWCLLNK